MKRKIMIVDDEPDIVDAIKTILEGEDYDTICAYSGEECLQKLGSEKVDLVLLDIRMPGMDGWETLRQMKERGVTNRTKVSMLTAVLRIGTDIFGLQDVVTDYIRKPFSMEKLIGSVRKALGEEKKLKPGKFIKVRRKGREVTLTLLPEARKKTAPRYRLSSGYSYLVEEPHGEHAFDIFKDHVTHGIPGLCITRKHLDKVRDEYKLKKSPILWLSKTPGELNLSPTDLGMLRHTILEYIRMGGESIVLLDGLEYLITHTNFKIVMRHLDDLNDAVMESMSKLIIPVDPRTLEEKQLALLERYAKPIRPKK